MKSKLDGFVWFRLSNVRWAGYGTMTCQDVSGRSWAWARDWSLSKTLLAGQALREYGPFKATNILWGQRRRGYNNEPGANFPRRDGQDKAESSICYHPLGCLPPILPSWRDTRGLHRALLDNQRCAGHWGATNLPWHEHHDDFAENDLGWWVSADW